MNKKILAVALGSLFASATFASTSVALVDLTQTFQQVPQGSAAFTALKQQLAPQIAQLQASQQSLQSQEDSLNANKKLSPSALATQKAQLAAQSQGLQKNIQAFQQSASQKEQALLTAFGNDVKAIVTQIAQKKGYDVVLSNQTTLYSVNGVDITSQVIAALEQQAQAGSSNS